MPKGTGASGEPLAISPDSVNKVPEEVLNPPPGSGMGGGGGNGMGRSRYPEKAGKVHPRGTGKHKNKKELAP